VDDIKKAVVKVTEAGGNVLGEPMAIPGVGSYVSLKLPTANSMELRSSG
jgi:predicted enzyme related to lactoylglutathione lyase